MELVLDPKWQIEAYKEVLKALDEKNKACVVAPPGCGKTPIGFQLMQDNPNEEILWLTPSDVAKTEIVKLVRQIYGKDIKEVFPNLKILTYSELSKKNYEELESFNPKIMIYDEIHRAGAEIWGINAGKLAKREGVKILGLTATPVRTDKRNMAVEICGGISYELGWIEAVARGIIPIPIFVDVDYVFDSDINKLENKIASVEDEKIRIEYITKLRELKDAKKRLSDAGNIQEVLAKYIQDGKWIAFCRNFEHMDELAENVFKTMESEPRLIEISSRLTPQENQNNLKLLRTKSYDGALVALTVNKLNEAFHDDELAGIISLRPTESYIVFIQQLGRILSQSMRTTPMILDLVGNLKYFRKFMSEIKMIIKEGLKAGHRDIYEEEILQNFKIIEEKILFVEAFRELDEKFHRLISKKLLTEETAFQQFIRYCKILKQHGVDFKELKLSPKKTEGQRRNVTLEDLDIPNIKEIIQEHEMDETYIFWYRLNAFRKDARSGRLGKDEIQELIDLRTYN